MAVITRGRITRVTQSSSVLPASGESDKEAACPVFLVPDPIIDESGTAYTAGPLTLSIPDGHASRGTWRFAHTILYAERGDASHHLWSSASLEPGAQAHHVRAAPNGCAWENRLYFVFGLLLVEVGWAWRPAAVAAGGNFVPAARNLCTWRVRSAHSSRVMEDAASDVSFATRSCRVRNALRVLHLIHAPYSGEIPVSHAKAGERLRCK